MHYHNCEEMVVVLEGEGECEIDGLVTPLKAQDAGYAPTGVHHCYRNTGSGVMKILWVYGAKEVTRTFVETGITVPPPLAPGPHRQLARRAAPASAPSVLA